MNLLDDHTQCIKIKQNNILQQEINFITIIDNIHFQNTKDLIEYILELYKYMVYIDIKKMLLVTTFPYKIIEITKDNFFTTFRNIINVRNKKDYSDEYYYSVLELCFSKIIPSCMNEIIMFTKFKNVVPIKALIEIKKIVEQPDTSFTLVSNQGYINQVKIKILTLNSKAYYDAIETGSIFNVQMNNHLTLIQLNNCTLYKSQVAQFLVNVNLYRCFLVNQVNETNNFIGEFDVTNTSDIKDILNALLFQIEFVYKSDKVDKDLYISLKDTLLQIIDQNDNIEAKHMAIILYHKLKKSCSKMINGLIYNENNKLFIEFGKKAEVKGNHNQIIKNINNIVDLDTVFTQNIQNFIDDNKNNDEENFIESCEFFNSTITLSNWFEEMENNNGIGLLVKINKNIINTTNTYMSIIDYIAMTLDYFQKNKNIKFGNLANTNIVKGVAVGEANALIPLYINKYHWNLNKKYLNMLLAIIATGNPFGYQPMHVNIYFDMFSETTIKMFDKLSLNENSIRNYVAGLRTCAEICFEKGYNRGISKIIKTYINDESAKIDFIKICSQALITGYYIDKDTIRQFIHYILIDLIKDSVSQSNDNKYIQSLKTLNNNELIKEATNTILKINNHMLVEIRFLMSYYKMNFILKDIIGTIGSYNKFIKSLDQNYGLMDHTLCQKMIQLVSKEIGVINIELKDLYQLVEQEYSHETVLFYAIQGLNKDNTRIIGKKEVKDIQNLLTNII
ncbi:hypothetical protein Klosneuvirus_1_267 [Klosneuvirus KNV1]|uniref:Uncharacterized protein n=1 Tax=Klosneuvirus KNV1 TaxID=1977640 RepID=A0A1V0SI63_9VIRU|nr:hypothetical protein Klosneuvirus_1_267 [Klosneuvirus KNV1]